MYAAVGCPSYGTLDNSCPLDMSHPTNVGIVSEWAVAPLPGWSGGLTFRDLVRGARKPRDGTLTNMAFPPTSSSGWGATSRIGGHGEARFDGSNDYVSIGNLGLTIASGKSCTFSCWFYAKVITAGNYVMMGQRGGGANIIKLAIASSQFDFAWDIFGTNARVIAGSPTLNTWTHLVGVYDGGQNKAFVYQNGALVGSSATAGGVASQTFPNFGLGTANGDNSVPEPFSGYLDELMIFSNVAFSLAKVAALYDQTKRGNPDRWRWVRGTAYSFPALGIQFDTAGNSGYQSLASSYSGSASWNGSNRALFIKVAMLSATNTVTAMTYGGATCTLIGAQSVAGGTGRVECWRICQNDSGAPASGSNTLSVTLSGSVAFTVTWVSRTGVNQTTPTEAFNSTSGINLSSGTASLVVTPVTAGTVVEVAIATNDPGASGNQTVRNDVTGAAGSGIDEDSGATPISPAAAQTMTVTLPALAGAMYAFAGYAVKPASTGGATTYNQNLTVSASMISTILKVVGKPISFTGVSATSTAKSVGKPRSFTGTSSSLMLRVAAKAMSLSAISISALVTLKTIVQSISASTASISIMARQTSKQMLLSVMSVSSLTRGIGKVMLASCSSASSVIRSISCGVTTIPASLSTIIRSIGKQQTSSSTSSSIAAKSVGKLVSVGAPTSSTTLVKTVGRMVGASALSVSSAVKSVSKTLRFTSLLSNLLTALKNGLPPSLRARVTTLKGYDGTRPTLKGRDGTSPTVKGDNLE